MVDESFDVLVAPSFYNISRKIAQRVMRMARAFMGSKWDKHF